MTVIELPTEVSLSSADHGPSVPLAPAVSVSRLTVRFGRVAAIRDLSIDFPARQVSALIGPSGCGKTTLLRAINRMHDETGAQLEGRVLVGGTDVYGPDARVELVRSRVGMVFQRPNPFPHMSIWDNTVAGLRFYGIRSRSVLDEAGEAALRAAALWDSVKDRLKEPATRLSGGQQQRLCIARALAVEPEVLLMDEPCSALDPLSTSQIEELITELAQRVTVVLVTHNLFQARRVAAKTAVLLAGTDGAGHLEAWGTTEEIFQTPSSDSVRAYVQGYVG